MNKTTKTIALFSVLSLMTVGCQKENTADYVPENSVAETSTVCTVQYAIDGVTHQLTLIGDEAWQAFLNRMLALAEEGHEVRFRNEETASRIVSAKEVVTYATKERDKAYAWADAIL